MLKSAPERVRVTPVQWLARNLMVVLWASPAFDAGLAPGLKIIAIDGEAFDADLLTSAISRAQNDKKPIELLVSNQDYFSTVRIKYDAGEH